METILSCRLNSWSTSRICSAIADPILRDYITRDLITSASWVIRPGAYRTIGAEVGTLRLLRQSASAGHSPPSGSPPPASSPVRVHPPQSALHQSPLGTLRLRLLRSLRVSAYTRPRWHAAGHRWRRALPTDGRGSWPLAVAGLEASDVRERGGGDGLVPGGPSLLRPPVRRSARPVAARTADGDAGSRATVKAVTCPHATGVAPSGRPASARPCLYGSTAYAMVRHRPLHSSPCNYSGTPTP
ncbi:hypothetical protein GUJ93_ZPchr0007g5446 [Zizania palustris]|uniref:Uncharacterized protein n=1 Tax=Zizania palustris TaxID=103762 RepID=A0A8J5W6M7_ZIZPA|nr:hypothetical protein GUJ93_ZPchr0007g5446 [Zizania palustris]